MAVFPRHERTGPDSCDVESPNPPAGVELVSAVDKVIVDLARNYNRTSLRVAGIGGGEQEPQDDTDLMAPVYFAPGANTNPLVPSSNPLHIARWITFGLYEQSTLHRIQRFARALLRVGQVSSMVATEIVANSAPSRHPVFIYSNTSRVATKYRGLDDQGQFADEFITHPEEQVRNYTLLIEDSFSFVEGQLYHARRFSP